MEKKIDPKGKEKKQTNRKKWYKAVCSLAAAVVVCTVYTLMLPALTLDEESAGDAGVTISESAVPASESPAAAESSPSDNGSESHSDTAADSSADSSPASAESGPAAAAPSADSAPSTNEPATLPSQDGENHTAVTLPAEETNNGAITGSSESQDEVTTPDTDDQEEIKDEESGSPAADSDSADEEDASDPTADVENANIWESTIPDLSNYTTWADKLVAVAQSQLGYHESVLNFNVKDGEHKGYTRYGEWYGSPYGDWCAMFVSFCLNYAGIENNDSIIPYNANCQTWVEQLTANKIFEDPDTYLPEPGDIVFFNQEGNRNGAANHVGIVSDVEYGTKTVKRHVVVGTETAVEDSAIALLTYANSLTSEETPVETLEATETEITVAKSIEVIEGNSSDQVQTVTYDMTDDSIIGFASMLEAEYINDGGNIDNIKNTDPINQPVTLEDKVAVQVANEKITINGGDKIALTGTISEYTMYDSWSSSNSNIVKITSYYDNTAQIEGILEGSATVSFEYWKWENSWRKKTDTWNIEVKYNAAEIYFLKTPTSDPSSNKVDQWAPDSLHGQLIGVVDTTDATWTGNKNLFLNQEDPDELDKYIVSWPDDSTSGTWTVNRGDTKFEYILDLMWGEYEKSIRNSLNLSAEEADKLQKTDVSAITLTPYKISKNNGGNYPIHIDCTISVNIDGYFAARFWLTDAADTESKLVGSGTYHTGSNITKTSYNTPSEKVINGVTYYFDGWYNEANQKVSDSAWNGGYTPNDTELSDGTVDFYARYVSEYTVNYKVGMGEGTVDPYNEKFSPIKNDELNGSTATPSDGYTFGGWYFDKDCLNPVPSEWVVDGKITPPREYDYDGDGTAESTNRKTFYAKFTSGVQLPETGAPGTTLLYLLGAMLTTAPLTITFIKRRKQKKEEN